MIPSLHTVSDQSFHPCEATRMIDCILWLCRALEAAQGRLSSAYKRTESSRNDINDPNDGAETRNERSNKCLYSCT
jgi:hypothetical protein